MTNSKQTKSALFSSVVALLLCFTMLLGTTFAWFTDSASTSVNKIQAGTLDIQLLDAEHKKRKMEKAAAASSTKSASSAPNRFNNFQQREYNFEEYEKDNIQNRFVGSCIGFSSRLC